MLLLSRSHDYFYRIADANSNSSSEFDFANFNYYVTCLIIIGQLHFSVFDRLDHLSYPLFSDNSISNLHIHALQLLMRVVRLNRDVEAGIPPSILYIVRL